MLARATGAELQEFGESVRARPDEAEGPSLALRRPEVEPEDEPRRPVPTQLEHIPR